MASKDWTFDLGTDKRGKFQVDAWASTIPHRTYSRLTREQLKQLRREINSALRRYPPPEHGRQAIKNHDERRLAYGQH